ncbi:hypothetical protein MCOR25_008444 [Pyricularia grisea]|uniref:Uncharacterized protein n=1 Tax=Pyricularia grisea TaxID=148305 RepID=A0A6P8AQX1_PYRGI|nr:uncharacterized protein PgNI_12129 [Pyricularia grisea]KAI6354860.1 hypothetical protein MCOR25_008444 [Pyricularia grisea]TLD04449.1 hypothetical protein PgNI_12129 [Pyricularia grisea]
MAGLLNGVSDAVGGVSQPLLGQEKAGNKNQASSASPTSSTSPSHSATAPKDNENAAEGTGLVQVSIPNLLPTSLLNGGNTRSTAVPTSLAKSTARSSSSTTAVPSSAAAPTSAAATNAPTSAAPTSDPASTADPATTPDSDPTTIPTTMTPLPTTLETIATSLPSTTAVPSLAQGLGAASSAVPSAAQSQSGGGFVMDPSKNPVMMALVIAVPIGLALIIGTTALLFKKGYLGSGRRKGRVIQDEIEHEAWQKVHAQKFGPSANY